jgi:hypothetical protein
MGSGWLSSAKLPSAKPMGAALSGRAVVVLGTTQSLLVFAACVFVYILIMDIARLPACSDHNNTHYAE